METPTLPNDSSTAKPSVGANKPLTTETSNGPSIALSKTKTGEKVKERKVRGKKRKIEEKTPKRSSAGFIKRDIWNTGEGQKVRSSQEKGKAHEPEKNVTAKTGRAKCIVCCLRCENSSHKESSFREGYKTSWYCTTCPKRAVEMHPDIISNQENAEVKGIPLCNVARFPGDPRTCWQIHHSDSKYPDLSCINKEKARDFKKRGDVKLKLVNHEPKPTTKRSKCVVCCFRCNKGKHEKMTSREGYKSRYVCEDCPQKAMERNRIRNNVPLTEPVTEQEKEEMKSIPLCIVPRFDDDPRTCFEIHHSNAPYPGLACSQRRRHIRNHRPVKNNFVKSGRAKCVVCCFRCKKSSHDKKRSREGYKTSWVCDTCDLKDAGGKDKPKKSSAKKSIEAKKKIKKEEKPSSENEVSLKTEAKKKPVPLCREPRFAGDNRTCWEIYHDVKNKMPHTGLSCLKSK